MSDGKYIIIQLNSYLFKCELTAKKEVTKSTRITITEIDRMGKLIISD
jgi:hypothetical protein